VHIFWEAYDGVLSIPIDFELTDDEQSVIIEKIGSFFERDER